MASSEHKTRIEIKIDDADAMASVDRLVSQLEKAQELAGSLSLNLGGVDGGGKSTGGGGGKSTGGGDGEKKEKKEKKDKPQPTWTGGALAGMGGAIQGLATASTSAHTQAMSNMLSAIRNYSKAFDKIKDYNIKIPKIGLEIPVGKALSAVSAGLDIASAGVSLRMGVASDIAGTEAGSAMYQNVTGNAGPGYGAGASYGFMPAQSTAITGQFAAGAGGQLGGDLLSQYNPFSLLRRGENPMIGASMLAATGPGGGAAGTLENIAQTRGSFYDSGFRSSSLDKIMQGFSSIADSLRDNGAKLDLNSLATAASASSFQKLGLRAGNVVNNTAGVATGAANEMLNPFKQLLKAKIIAKSFSEGNTLAESIQNMRDFGGDPNQQMEMFRDSGEVGELLMMSVGADLEGASTNVKSRAGDTSFYKPGERSRTRALGTSGMGFSSAFAESKGRLMDSQKGDLDGIKTLLKMSNNLQIALMKYSTMFDFLSQAIVGATDAAFSLINAISKLVPGAKATKPFKQKTTAPLTNQQQGERALNNKILIGEQ